LINRIWNTRSGAHVTLVSATFYVLSREDFDAIVKAKTALGGRLFAQPALAISWRLRTADTELRTLEER